MKRKTLLIFLLFLSLFSQAEKLELNGIYLGKNLYVMNPFADSGIGYCIYEVTVNGQISSDEINSSAFEIDLSQFSFEIGDEISVVLRYKNGCIPRVINTDVIQPKASFVLQNADVDKKGTLHWSTRKELGSLTFIVQQYRWNKWITVGEVDGIGTPGLNKYEMNVRPHSGENIFRLCQIDYTGNSRYSDRIIFESRNAKISFGPDKVHDELLLTDQTLYEIYDSYGNIVFKGFGNKINLKGLQSGLYYINYDNTMGSFRKR